MKIKEGSLEIRPIDRDLFLGKDYLPTFSFSSEGASLCRRETGEREHESARGTMGRENKGRERLPPFLIITICNYC